MTAEENREIGPRAITLDDLFRITYRHGGRVSLLVTGGHAIRHVVAYDGVLYDLGCDCNRRLLLELAVS